jgi:hypothetical protein
MIGWFRDWILLSEWFFPDLDLFGLDFWFLRIRAFYISISIFSRSGFKGCSVGFSGFRIFGFFSVQDLGIV